MLALVTAGVVAGLLSAPHCALMCGPIAAYSARDSVSASIRYQLGRMLSYAGAGAIAALLGKPVIRLLWNSDVSTALSWALALLMAAAAYRAWPRAKAKSQDSEGLIQITKQVGRDSSNKKKVSPIVRLLSRFPRKPMLLGAFSVLIPCAALWGGLVIAASSGSAIGGVLAMTAFSLTSSTGLLASSFLAGRLGQRPSHHRLLSVVFALGALGLLLRPLSMHLDAPSEGDAGETPAANCPLHPGGGQ